MSTYPDTPKRRPTVLLVEDDEMLRRLLSRTLRDEGFRVLEAENGDAALQIVSGLSRAPGVVLTDIVMPVMDGIELARIFGSRYPSVPILFMSGAMPHASRDMPLLEVSARLLLKPFGPEVLLEAIRAALNHERRRVQRTSA
jgi:two-component system, cell cycle sensor histidine kinase and response regulator CckA